MDSEMNNLSLVELYGYPPVNSISKFVRVTQEIDVSDLAQKYKELMKIAPRRHEWEREYFVGHDVFLGGKEKSNRKEEHLAGALFNECQNGKEFLLPDKRKLKIIDYQFPLKAKQDDKGIGKIDLFGVIDKEIPCVIELKVDPDSGGKSDTPLRALLEGLAYCAIVEANKKEIWQEVQSNMKLKFKGSRPHMIIMAPEQYWDYYFNKSVARDWPNALKTLVKGITQNLEIHIHFYSIENAEFEWGGNGKPAKMKRECKVQLFEPLESILSDH